jgi:hypothetical protein
MSCESVRQWKEFCETLVRQEIRQDWPHITCAEDLVLAARAVRKSFQNSVSLLRTEDDKPINVFDQRKYGHPVWYRGEAHRDSNSPLCPGVFREDYYLPGVNGFRSAEKWMITEFWRKAVLRSPYCPEPERRLAWLALARHHGLPTRLLDWSESISTAAWMATYDDEKATFARRLAEARSDLADVLAALDRVSSPLKETVLAMLQSTTAERVKGSRPPASTESVIWALSPALLNWHFTTPNNGAFIFLRNNDAILQDAFTGDTSGADVVWAIWVQDVHPRMMSQNAYFTIHGTDKSLDILNQGVPENRRFLRKLIVEPQARSQILKDLTTQGVTRSSIYPDLDNLAADIAEKWKDIVSSVKSGQQYPAT